MKERPILMSAPMVRACMRLVEPKTQTRRIVKPQPTGVLGHFAGDGPRRGNWWFSGGPHPFASFERRCPYGEAGDRLWVRENFRLPAQFDGNRPVNVKENVKIHYEANGAPRAEGAPFGKLRPAIHFPRIRCRVVLEVTDVRVERLQDISEADAAAEGLYRDTVIVGTNCNAGHHAEEHASRYWPHAQVNEHHEGYDNAVDAYRELWEAINGAGSWDANPYVWAITFKRSEP